MLNIQCTHEFLYSVKTLLSQANSVITRGLSALEITYFQSFEDNKLIKKIYNVQVKFSIHSGDSRHVSNKEFKMRS